MEEQLNYLSEQLEQFGLILSHLQKQQLYQFYEMVIETNKVMNLTSIVAFPEVVEKHFLDSLSLRQVVDLERKQKVIDIGTGAGFPGIPLKIVFPKLQITLMDSLKKRVAFLDNVIEALNLSSIDTVHARAEELGRNPSYREKYDLSISRAVANLCILEEYALPFLSKGGTFVSYKSGNIEEEVKEAEYACRLLGGKLEGIYKFHIKEKKRSFVITKKICETPKKYPRNSGIPAKKPLRQ